MREDQPSGTAFRVALRRAAHQLLDHPPVFSDPLALRIVGKEGVDALQAEPGRGGHPGFEERLRAFLAVRSRIAEERLAQLVAQGVEQYVVLGAGLDTFAYRNSNPGLRVFEVDHPATQGWKQRLLREAEIGIPATLRYVAVDFEHQRLETELEGAGFRTGTGAFFSWLGVTPYLTEASILATLHSIHALCGNLGGIVFDYATPATDLTPAQRQAFDGLMAGLAAAGEPWRSFFEPGALIGTLGRIGFGEIEDLGAEELNQRYFRGRQDGLQVGRLGRILWAGTHPDWSTLGR